MLTATFCSKESGDLITELEKQRNIVKTKSGACIDIFNRQVAAQTSQVLVTVDEQQTVYALMSISEVLYKERHRNVSCQRTEGTGQWILERKDFIRWQDTQSLLVLHSTSKLTRSAREVNQ